MYNIGMMKAKKVKRICVHVANKKHFLQVIESGKSIGQSSNGDCYRQMAHFGAWVAENNKHGFLKWKSSLKKNTKEKAERMLVQINSGLMTACESILAIGEHFGMKWRSDIYATFALYGANATKLNRKDYFNWFVSTANQ